MLPDEQEKLTYRLTHGAPLAVLLALGILLAYELLAVLELIAVAMLIALVLRTIVRALERLGAPPWLAVAILLSMILGFIAVIHWVIIPGLVQEATRRIPNGPGPLGELTDLVHNLPFINSPQFLQRLKDYPSQMIGTLPALITNTASALAAAVVGLFLVIYMAVSPGPLIGAILRIVPVERRPAFTEFLELLGERLRGWIVGTIIVAAFIGVSTGVGLWMLGVPLPLTFGLLASVLDVMPYLGSIISALFPTFVALTISPEKALEVLALYIVLNQIEAYIIYPQVMGREVDLQPALILVSFMVFGALLGLVGVFLAMPAAVLIGVLVDELTEKKPLGNEQAIVEEAAGAPRE